MPQTAIWLPRLFIIVDRKYDINHEDGDADDADRDDGICEDDGDSWRLYHLSLQVNWNWGGRWLCLEFNKSSYFLEHS